MKTAPKNHNKEVIYNNKGNHRQPGATPTDSDMPSEIQSPPDTQSMYQKIAKFTAKKIIMENTPTNHNKKVIYNIKGNSRKPQDTPTASETPIYPLHPHMHTIHAAKDNYATA